MALVDAAPDLAIQLSGSGPSVAGGSADPLIRTEANHPELELATPERARRRTSLLESRKGPIDRDAHRVPASQYAILAVWLGLLLALYLWARVVCWLGAPPDCTADSDIVSVMHDFQFLLFCGFVLAVLTGLHWPDRFEYVFDLRGRPCPRGVVFLLGSFAVAGLWGCLDLVPGLSSFSLTAGGVGGWHLLLVVPLALGGVWLVAWHFWRALAGNSRAGFLAYVLSRFAILGFYCVYGIASTTSRGVSFHLHHYIVGFLIASLSEFNHPISVALLAIGTGLFVQGIAAYDADPILSHQQFRIHNYNKTVVSPQMSEEAADWTLQHCLRFDM